MMQYLVGTRNLGLYFQKNKSPDMIGYADAGFMSDPHRGRLQTGYVFLKNGAPISFRSQKQSMAATSSNHSEILALHEASRECIWLRGMTNHIVTSCGLPKATTPTIIMEDNRACIDQLQKGFIKGDRTKHILPKFFSTHEFIQDGKIDVQQVRSCDNLADLFTKALPTKTHRDLVNRLGMRRLSILKMLQTGGDASPSR